MVCGLAKLTTYSVEYTGNTTFKADSTRGYFFIVMTVGAGTIEFGDGGGEIPIAEGEHYNPPVSPTTKITVRTAGTFVVHSNSHITV